MNTLRFLSAVIFVTACSGSDGRSAAQLVEVEATIQNGSSTTIERIEISYEGSHLREVARVTNGMPTGSARFTYGANGIELVEYTDDEGDRATEQLTYEGGHLARSRYEIAGVRIDERTMTYASGALKEVSTVSSGAGATGSTSVVRYEYDADGRTSKLLQLAGGDSSSTELRYATDGSLERASVFEGGALRETFTFEFEGDRIAEIVDGKNGRHEISYDDSGRISEVKRSTSSGTTTLAYRYGEGSVEGWTFAPAIPVSQLFDLGGNEYATVSLLHGDIELPRDLPRASGGGGGGGGGNEPMCGFEPVSACDTCIEQSCCSEAAACLTGSACAAFVDCATPCTTQECVTICGETNPTGQSDYQNLVSCAQAFCPTSCNSGT